MNIQELLGHARERLKSKSDNQLCRDIGIPSIAYRRYRDGHGLPSEPIMIRLSRAAGIAPEQGLVLLNMWRSEGEAATVYRRIFNILEKSRNGNDNKEAREHQ